MTSKITVYGIINHDESDLFESAGSLTLRTPRNVPNFNETTQMTVPGYVKQICAGQSHILTLTQDGSIYSYGSNQFGQRGTTGSGFQLVMKNVNHIAVGLYHSVAITKDNKVFVWGRGSEGQLGLGDNENVEKPTELNIKGEEVCCGSFHTLIRYEETCYVMGENFNGQLGVQGFKNLPLKLGIPVEQMAAGLDHSIFLYKGSVFVTGNNLFGQCGLADQVIKEPIKLPLNFEVSKILASMGTFSGAISKQDKIYFWGTGSWGYARKCTPLEDLCKLDEGQKITQVIPGENFAMLKCQDGWYVFGMNKIPDNYSQQQTHRIQLQKVSIVEGQIYSGLNIVFSCCHIQDIPKPIQQMAVDQGSYVSQQSDSEQYRSRSSYKQSDLRQSTQYQSSASYVYSNTMKTSQVPTSALRQSTQLPQYLTQQQYLTNQNSDYQQMKFETCNVKEVKLTEVGDNLYKSGHKNDFRQDLKLDLRSDSKPKGDIPRTPDVRADVKKENKSEYRREFKEDDIRQELKQELLKLEKKQEQFKQDVANQQSQLEKRNENIKEITFGFKSDCKPLQERNVIQKCYECQHLSQKNDYFQKHIRFQEEEITNLKKELDIIKQQMKQKDVYVNELESRILKYQESNFKYVPQPSQVYKPSLEIRLKSEEKQAVVREEPHVNYSKIIDFSPKVFRQAVIEQSPKERCFNTSIIDKIQSYQQTAKATRPVHQNLMNRYSAHEVQAQQPIYQASSYVQPQYYKRN